MAEPLTRSKRMVQLALKKTQTVKTTHHLPHKETTPSTKVKEWLKDIPIPNDGDQEEDQDDSVKDPDFIAETETNCSSTEIEVINLEGLLNATSTDEEILQNPPIVSQQSTTNDRSDSPIVSQQSTTNDRSDAPIVSQQSTTNDRSDAPIVSQQSTTNDRSDAPIVSQQSTTNDRSDAPIVSQQSTTNDRSDKKKPTRLCKFCNQFQTHLTRHIQRRHKEEKEVVSAMNLPVNERQRAFDNIKKAGIFKANADIHRKDNKASLIRERRQGTADTAMCTGCLGFFDTKNMFRHKTKCTRIMSQQADTVKMTGLSQSGRDLGVTQDFKVNILDRFRQDPVGEICRTDLVTLLLGKKQWERSIKKERGVIMGEMRLMSNLIYVFRNESKNQNASGMDVLNYRHFDVLEKVVRTLCDSEEGQKAGLKLRIGFVLKKAVNVMKGYCVMKGEFENETNLSRFIDVLNLNWNFIFYSAQVECELKRGGLRKPSAMPLEEDISTFRNFILDQMAKEMNQFEPWDKHNFIKMRNLILTRLTMFNARRGGEPSRLTLKEWREAITDAWIDKNLIEAIDDPMEKYLIDNLKLAYQAGKGHRKLVPVLFPTDTIEPITKLISERMNSNVSEENTYLFPNTGQSTDHASGYHCVQSVVKQCPGLKQPHLLIADKFRHRVSTMFAQLDIPEDQRAIFYRHMGHSESINKNVYQCPLAVTEITRVGDFLLNTIDVPSHETLEATGETDPLNNTYLTKSSTSEAARSNEQSNKLCEEVDSTLTRVTLHPEDIQCVENESNKLQDTEKHRRRYTRWSDHESSILASYFKKYIEDTTNNGCLPSKKEVLVFLSKNQILEGYDDKANLVRTKIFNEKKRYRNLFKKSQSKY